ncbi:serine protease inhibitor 77Ba-like [Trichoplusia ni]|uniref:Serine protease inhibitor 77Ba-like n=1 Tax=Trichoplusia ni TaxID=7111 RepID=A0A7E5VQX5_TRINI|nr:serine protease inhibitor 77Ba-like [Trichoplusia ni]
MRLTIVVVALCLAHAYGDDIVGEIAKAPEELVHGAVDLVDGFFGGGKKYRNPCTRDISKDYKRSINKFYNRLYNQVAARNDYHFVFSPISVWLSLSALAEGADPPLQSQLFNALHLPKEACARDRYYKIALSVERTGHDVTFIRRRSLFLDESLKINPEWERNTHRNSEGLRLLNFNPAPIKGNPEAASKIMSDFLATPTNLAVTGNSIILDYLEYQGLWEYAFSEASIHLHPFFDEAHNVLGQVEMMRMKKRVRLAHVPFMKAKVLELPVGEHGRYTMLFASGTENCVIKDAVNIFMSSIMDIFPLLTMSLVPIDIAIPRFCLTSEFNLRGPLEDIGIREYWMDPLATSNSFPRFVSDPPAAPGGLIQHVSVKVGPQGLKAKKRHHSGLLSSLFGLATDTVSDVAKIVGHDFIADKPFIFALFDTETHTCIFAGAYSKPMPPDMRV